MTENNGGVWREKVMSKKNQGLQHRGEKRWKQALLLGNDKSNVIVNYLLSYFLC